MQKRKTTLYALLSTAEALEAPAAAALLALMSLTAALIASSASIEQCSLTGGRLRCFAMSLFLMAVASSSVRPFTHSVATDELAIAEPHPKVLKHASVIAPVAGSTRICSFMTSPQAGAPTRPVPTSGSCLSKAPTLRGRS